ncbi:holin [Streptomyces chartreusis]|uniref:holin n=1 Tax=Streptomyces chartreusis TaxID=1969 RepID=UPI00380F01A2
MASPSAPIEKKVKLATAVTYLLGVAGLAIVGAVQNDPNLISSMPDALEPFVLAMLPAAGAAIGGWAAPHTPRADA